MRLDINDKYCITSDERQYVVNQIGATGPESKEPGTEVLRPLGYFSTLNQCLKYLVNKQVRESDCKSLKEVISLMQKLNDEIDQVCNF